MKTCPNCGFILRTEKSRSIPENNYLHGVVLPILAQHTGYTAQEMKAVLKWHFNIKSTSQLSTAEFEAFMSKIRMWASDPDGLNCYIPMPNEGAINVM